MFEQRRLQWEVYLPFGPQYHLTALHRDLISLLDGSYRTLMK